MTSGSGGPKEEWRRRARWDIRRELVDTLRDMPELRKAKPRKLLVRLVEEEFGESKVQSGDDLNLWTLELALACLTKERGLPGLVRHLDLVNPHSSDPVACLADEWNAVDFLYGLPGVHTVWPTLHMVLPGLDLPYKARRTAIQEATEGDRTSPPAHASHPWHDFVWLTGQKKRTDALPPSLVFLDQCSEHAGSATADITGFVKNWAGFLGLPYTSLVAAAPPPARSPQAGKDFFVDYDSADVEWAEWIAWQLEDAGYSVMLKKWDSVPGNNRWVGLEAGLFECRRTIAVLSPDYLASARRDQVRLTAQQADPSGGDRRLVPISVKRCEPVGLLAGVVHIDLTGLEISAAQTRLLDGISVALGGRAKPAAAPRFPG